MKTIFEINIIPTGGGGTMLRRVRDLPFLRCVGTAVGDGAWKEARRITGVVLEFDDAGKPYA